MDNTQNIISFCTGYSGLEIGIKRAGVDVRVICNVEIEAFVQANLVAKTEEGRMDNAPIWTDLKTFPAREFRGKVHGLIGGYPCQPFSSAGKRQGEKDPRHLWPYILKHVRAIRPVWCFWENVAGHTTMGLWRVLSDLEEEGYRTTFGIFSAEEVGAPHQRKRVFILACLPNTQIEGARTAKESNQKCLGRDLNQMQNWPTPRTCGGSRPNGKGGKILDEEVKIEAGIRERGKILAEEAKIHNGLQDQEKSNTSGKSQGSPKLNPNWVEQLMGLSTGWTDLGSWGMELSPKQQN